VGEGIWEFEIGEPQKAFNPEADHMAPSGDNVFIPSIICTGIANLYAEGH
jgi:hypothetical protein